MFESGRIVLEGTHESIFRGNHEGLDILFMRTLVDKSILCATVVDLGHKVIPLALMDKGGSIEFSATMLPNEWKHYIRPIIKHIVEQPVNDKYEYSIEY